MKLQSNTTRQNNTPTIIIFESRSPFVATEDPGFINQGCASCEMGGSSPLTSNAVYWCLSGKLLGWSGPSINNKQSAPAEVYECISAQPGLLRDAQRWIQTDLMRVLSQQDQYACITSCCGQNTWTCITVHHCSLLLHAVYCMSTSRCFCLALTILQAASQQHSTADSCPNPTTNGE